MTLPHPIQASGEAHTPGPWQHQPGFHKGRVEDADGIAVGLALGKNAESQANARLIAAAPDLLYAATLLSELGEVLGENNAAVVIARAAIAKARP